MPKKVPPGPFDKRTLIDAIKRDLKVKGRKANFDTALLIAANAFHGCYDRNNQPIAVHFLQVFRGKTRSNKKRSIGALHDLPEDTDWTLDDLREVGFHEKVVLAVGVLTIQEGEKYFDYIERVGLSFFVFRHKHYAIDPKIDDLDHNMGVWRESSLPSDKYIEKLKLYTVAREYLVAIKVEDIKPGTPIAEFMQLRPELYDAELLQKYSSGKRRTVLDEKAGAPQPKESPQP